MAARGTTMAAGAAAALFALFLVAQLQLAACYNGVVSGSVSCLDCHGQSFNLSGIEMMVKCDKEKKLAMATTEDEGSFEAEVPASGEASADCVVQILGGTQKLYGRKNATESHIVKVGEDDSGKPYYTTATPLSVSTSCPKERNCSDGGVGDSRFFEIPREWGLAPSSEFFKFVPIIGIP